MTELINSLKTFAYSGSAERKNSSGQLIRTIPLLNLSGRADSCSDSGFNQWRDAMRMIARLPSGIPLEFRLRLWENLSDRYMQDNGIVWSRVIAKCRVPNSRDGELADQIEKDLHRTGCTGFSGAKQAMLKKVLVSYARWNPAVGYCQGFNMIGAMLLQMTGGNETLTLKVFIFLIEGVLPQGYFSQGLRGLAVDMAVFREILKLRKPTLNAHLSRLQQGEDNPPLTDVFTMHWFLTLFIHCLPTNSVLRIWDLVLLEGSEVLLRTALVLWAAIETRILGVSSADEFYSVMGVVTREMLEFGLMDPNSLVKCIVSVGPFPFPGLQDLRVKHRALIAQETPHKSFFLAKRELDNLKRHYAAIRHRQRATTIILKGLEASTRRAAGQRSASLFVASTKKQVVSPKPKNRRASFGKSPIDCNTNTTKGNSSANNNNNNSISRVALANSSQQANNLRNCSNNTTAPNGNPVKLTSKQQVTMTWDKAAKKPKNFRRRRTASASSHTTSSSSSTELCDSSDSSSDSEGVWTDSDSRWKKKPKVVVKDKSPDAPAKELVKNDSNKIEENGPQGITPQIKILSDKSPSPTTKSVEDLILEEISAEVDLDSKCIDTNDSQHFLEEMSRLGKSDSFYENLSQRICELQFQNLHILTTCNTVIEPTKMLVPFEVSPLPSPISPMPPMRPTFNDSLEIDCTKLTLSPNLVHISNNASKSPCPSPRLLSPRGSISSNAESPLPKSPMSPSPDFSNFRKLSKSSISSAEIPEILIENKENIPAELEDGMVEVEMVVDTKIETKNENVNSSDPKIDTATTVLMVEVENKEENVDISTDIISEKKDEDIKDETTETKDKLVSNDEGKIEIMDQDYVILQDSFSTALETLTECSRQPSNLKISHLPLTPADLKSPGGAIIAPEIPLDFSVDCVDSSKDVPLPPSKENSIVDSESTPILGHNTAVAIANCGSGTSSNAGDAFTFDNVVPCVEPGTPGCNVRATPPTFLDLPLPSPTTLKTAACPCQCQTTEDINAVIRENIAILQRLKLKPAYDDDDEDKYEDDDLDEYDDSSTDFDLGFSPNASACAENDSSDQDSGIPISFSQGNSTPKRIINKMVTSIPPLQLSQLSLDDAEGAAVSISNATTSASASPILVRRHSSSSSKSKVKLTGNKSSSKSTQPGKPKPKKVFNPFPTARKSRVRTTSKFGLYS